jgi:hypothetical protein
MVQNFNLGSVDPILYQSVGQTISIGQRQVRLYSHIPTGPIRMSDISNGYLQYNFGGSYFFNWYGSGTGNYLTISKYFPEVQAGDVIVVVYSVYQTNGWFTDGIDTYQYAFSYGTAAQSAINANIYFRKATYQQAHYDGADTIYGTAFYAGDDTDYPFGTQYVMSVSWGGTNNQNVYGQSDFLGFSGGCRQDNLNQTWQGYINANPQNSNPL